MVIHILQATLSSDIARCMKAFNGFKHIYVVFYFEHPRLIPENKLFIHNAKGTCIEKTYE